MHRPYPAPSTQFDMRQTWHDLLFMHWPVSVDALRPHIPSSLTIDTFDDTAWIAVVPFRMSGVYPRGLFPVPWLSAFAELNVRTYVTKDGKPGVWFFSLDAANGLAVQIARTWFSLPYFHARMTCATQGDGIRYASERIHPRAPSAQLDCDYAPASDVFEAKPGSIEWFLTARYCLYTSRRGRLLRGEIEHLAWPLQIAQAEVRVNTMTAPHAINLPDTRPLLHFARKLDVQVWGLKPADPPSE